MPALLDTVDPQGLEEFSVVFTDRSLNHMSTTFQDVMRDISEMLKDVYNADAVVVVAAVVAAAGLERVAEGGHEEHGLRGGPPVGGHHVETHGLGGVAASRVRCNLILSAGSQFLLHRSSCRNSQRQ